MVTQVTLHCPWDRGHSSISTKMRWIEGQIRRRRHSISQLVYVQGHQWWKIIKRLWNRARPFSILQGNDIIISCIHAQAYMHIVTEGREKKYTFFPRDDVLCRSSNVTNSIHASKKSPHRGDIMQNDYVWKQLSQTFAYSQTTFSLPYIDDRSNQDMWWQRL